MNLLQICFGFQVKKKIDPTLPHLASKTRQQQGGGLAQVERCNELN